MYLRRSIGQLHLMLKYFFLLVLFFGTTFAYSQSYAYIDSDYILSKVPEYVQAKEKLDKLAERWTKEIEDRYEAIKGKKSNFEREEILLPKEERIKRKEEIENLEQQIIRGIAHSSNESLITLIGIKNKPGISALIFNALSNEGISVDMIVQSSSINQEVTDITFTIPETDLLIAKKAIKKLQKKN